MTTTTTAPTMAPPRYATPRTPGRRSFGAAIAAVAEALGKPLQAWQRHVADVATELVPDPAGSIVVAGERHSWAYRTVVVHVQRQAGKTTLLGPVNLHRCVLCPGGKTWLTAQSRQDARDTWLDVADVVARSPLADLIGVRRSNGSEALQLHATGSTFRVFAPAEDALHGKANQAVSVDELWAFDAVTGMALEQAIKPTFATTGGQLWLTSTAGTAASTWLRGYVERGRAAVAGGLTTGIAYFEWSLAPEPAAECTELLTRFRQAETVGDDELLLLDRVADLVMSAHPGEYVRRDAIVDAARDMAPGEFLRAYGNVWTLTADRTIPDHEWAAIREPRDEPVSKPEPGAVALSFAVAIDRSRAAIGAGWQPPELLAVDAVDIVDSRPGVRWLADRVEQLARQLRVEEVAYDGSGPNLDVAAELARRGVKLRKLTSSENQAACAGFLQAVHDRTMRHRGHADLDAAVAVAARRELGDGWAWSRRGSAGSIAELEAVTVARYASHTRPAAPAAPVVASRATPKAAELSRPARRSLVSK